MKYLSSTTWGSKNIGMTKSGCVSNFQLLSSFYSVFNDKMIDIACNFDLKRFMPQSMNVKSLKIRVSLSVPFMRAGLILITCGLVLVPCEWGRIFSFCNFYNVYLIPMCLWKPYLYNCFLVDPSFYFVIIFSPRVSQLR